MMHAHAQNVYAYECAYTKGKNKANTNLFPGVNAIFPQDGRRAGGDPNSSQHISIHLILLDQSLALFVLKQQK